MKNTLYISGENKSVKLVPENDADKKILEILAECQTTGLTTHRRYKYSDDEIESIEITFAAIEKYPSQIS